MTAWSARAKAMVRRSPQGFTLNDRKAHRQDCLCYAANAGGDKLRPYKCDGGDLGRSPGVRGGTPAEPKRDSSSPRTLLGMTASEETAEGVYDTPLREQ